jgi:cytochrome c oxidase assembly protein subunit 11
MNGGLARRNRRLMAGLLAVAFGMVGLAYASVPLYSLFCSVTGFGGTTQRAETAPDMLGERAVTVRFNADVQTSLPWAFRPSEPSVVVRLGEQKLTSFRATNRAARATVGTATFNVTPDAAGKYFTKIECFCFTEQTLAPGQTTDMPVLFYVDPKLAEDPALDGMNTITLSYTFFRAADEAAVLAAARTNR